MSKNWQDEVFSALSVSAERGSLKRPERDKSETELKPNRERSQPDLRKTLDRPQKDLRDPEREMKIVTPWAPDGAKNGNKYYGLLTWKQKDDKISLCLNQNPCPGKSGHDVRRDGCNATEITLVMVTKWWSNIAICISTHPRDCPLLSSSIQQSSNSATKSRQTPIKSPTQSGPEAGQKFKIQGSLLTSCCKF